MGKLRLKQIMNYTSSWIDSQIIWPRKAGWVQQGTLSCSHCASVFLNVALAAALVVLLCSWGCAKTTVAKGETTATQVGKKPVVKEEEVEETPVQKRLAHMDEADEICYYPASQIYHKLGCPYPERDLNKCKVKIMKPCKYCFPQQKPKRGWTIGQWRSFLSAEVIKGCPRFLTLPWLISTFHWLLC